MTKRCSGWNAARWKSFSRFPPYTLGSSGDVSKNGTHQKTLLISTAEYPVQFVWFSANLILLTLRSVVNFGNATDCWELKSLSCRTLRTVHEEIWVPRASNKRLPRTIDVKERFRRTDNVKKRSSRSFLERFLSDPGLLLNCPVRRYQGVMNATFSNIQQICNVPYAATIFIQGHHFCNVFESHFRTI
jgi:hypothetical protein